MQKLNSEPKKVKSRVNEWSVVGKGPKNINTKNLQIMYNMKLGI